LYPGSWAGMGKPKVKVYLDGQFVGEGTPFKGFDLRGQVAPGAHLLEISTLITNLFSTEEVRKNFQITFPAPGIYQVRLDYLDKGKIDLVSADVMRVS
jgi:hypothetical protein